MALISVLLVVALAVTLATGMISRQTLLIHQTANRIEQVRAEYFALGGEEIARQLLYEDAARQEPVDHLGDAWAQVFQSQWSGGE